MNKRPDLVQRALWTTISVTSIWRKKLCSPYTTLLAHLKKPAAVSDTPTFLATATAIPWFKDKPSSFARRCAAFFIDVGSFNRYVALLMLSPSSADRPDSAPKSGVG